VKGEKDEREMTLEEDEMVPDTCLSTLINDHRSNRIEWQKDFMLMNWEKSLQKVFKVCLLILIIYGRTE
jgi:hypothetical protein